MSKRRYELTFIIPPALSDDEVGTIEQTVTGWITDQQGEIVKSNHWGRRRLAYSVKNYKEGYYILLEVDAEPLSVKELDRRLRLESNVLRHLVVRADD